MSYVKRSRVTLTTDASSGSTGYTSEAINGQVLGVHYTFQTGFSTSASVAIIGETTGINVLSAALTSTTSKLWQPRGDIHSTGGSTVAGFEPIPIGDERLQITLSSGGAAKNAIFDVLYG